MERDGACGRPHRCIHAASGCRRRGRIARALGRVDRDASVGRYRTVERISPKLPAAFARLAQKWPDTLVVTSPPELGLACHRTCASAALHYRRSTVPSRELGSTVRIFARLRAYHL